MDLNFLVGKKFQETELFELISFDIETDRTLWLEVFAHINFERISSSEILVTDVQIFSDLAAYDTKSRCRNPEVEEWFDISGGQAPRFMYIRKGAGQTAVFFKDRVHVQPSYFWYRDTVEVRELTQEEIALAFAELAGLLPVESKSKRSA